MFPLKERLCVRINSRVRFRSFEGMPTSAQTAESI